MKNVSFLHTYLGPKARTETRTNYLKNLKSEPPKNASPSSTIIPICRITHCRLLPLTHHNFPDFRHYFWHVKLVQTSSKLLTFILTIFQDIFKCSKLSLKEIPYVRPHTSCNHATQYAKSNPPKWATWSSKGFRIHQHIAEKSGLLLLKQTLGHTAVYA